MNFIPYCSKTLKELRIEDEQGVLDLVRFKEHIKTCPYCKKFIFLFREDSIDNLIDDFGRYLKVYNW